MFLFLVLLADDGMLPSFAERAPSPQAGPLPMLTPGASRHPSVLGRREDHAHTGRSEFMGKRVALLHGWWVRAWSVHVGRNAVVDDRLCGMFHVKQGSPWLVRAWMEMLGEGYSGILVRCCLWCSSWDQRGDVRFT